MNMNEDIAEIVRLDALCFPEEPLGEGRINTLLASGTTVIYCQGIGYALVYYGEEICTVLRIGVAPDRRREGHAQEMLQEVLERVTTPITLRVEKGNPALLLYKRLDFIPVAHTKDHLLLTYEPSRADFRSSCSEIGSYPLAELAQQHPHT